MTSPSLPLPLPLPTSSPETSAEPAFVDPALQTIVDAFENVCEQLSEQRNTSAELQDQLDRCVAEKMSSEAPPDK